MNTLLVVAGVTVAAVLVVGFVRWLSRPRRTAESVVRELIDGIENGTVTLTEQPDVRVVDVRNYQWGQNDEREISAIRKRLLEVSFGSANPKTQNAVE